MSEKSTRMLVKAAVFAVCTLAVLKSLEMGHTGFAVFFLVMAFLSLASPPPSSSSGEVIAKPLIREAEGASRPAC